MFLKWLATKVLKYSSINKYTINIKIDKQLSYKVIYTIELIRIETLKTYIKTNLANNLSEFSNFLLKFVFYLLKSQIVAFA